MKFRTRIFSRHPSHNILRSNLERLPFRSLVRFGSLTKLTDGKQRIELNSSESITISANKLLMKKKFDEAGVATAQWLTGSTINEIFDKMGELELQFPIVAKSLFGSKGIGNSLVKSEDHLHKWASGRDLNRYIFEKYVPYQLEFRLHVTKNDYFYTCRKALKSDCPDSDKWRRHVDNSVWLLETNTNFNKPNSWTDVVSDCIKALKTIGADILSFDVRVQGPLNKKGEQREYQKFILLECNSASSMSPVDNKEISICAQKYLSIIPQLLKEKYNETK